MLRYAVRLCLLSIALIVVSAIAGAAGECGRRSNMNLPNVKR